MALLTRTVINTYTGPNGTTAATGRVRFRPNTTLTSPGNDSIVPRTYIDATLVNGAISQALVRCDDPTISPVGWAWEVTEEITGAPVRRYLIQLVAGSGSVALADLAHLEIAPALVTYEEIAHKGVANGYASLGSDGLVPDEQLPAGSGSGVTSVNGDSGPAVVLDYADVGADPAGAASAVAALALLKAGNLSDLADAVAARLALGLGTSATRDTGTSNSQVILGNDARLADARTPTTHASTHATGGSDPITADSISAYRAEYGNALNTYITDALVRILGLETNSVTFTRQILAGIGLTGGGDLSADRTLTVVYGTSSTTATVGNDTRVTGAAQKASNLSDLGSASTARTNLGLGGAAVLAVGTSAGTVAAGDDSRITGAAQKASNLADLASPATARTSLGLANTATLTTLHAEKTSDQGQSSATLADITSLGLAIPAAGIWDFEIFVPYTGDTNASSPITLNLTGPTATFAGYDIYVQGSATGKSEAVKTALSSSFTGPSVTTAGTIYAAWVKGRVTVSGAGTLQPQFAGDATHVVTVKAGAWSTARQVA